MSTDQGLAFQIAFNAVCISPKTPDAVTSKVMTPTGIGDDQLNVIWPNSTIAVLALLLPDEMTNALMKEIERVSNLPMPLPQRKRRIAELRREIDELQRQALALGEDASGLPPEVVLGVRVAEIKVSRAA